MTLPSDTWNARSWEVIGEVHASLPEHATVTERRNALKAAYPFGERKHFPYKAWCKAQRAYLARYAAPKQLPPNLLEGWL